MARPRKIQNTDFLPAAREVFLRKGMAGTTKEIAKKAGVSEATLFKRFPKTPELFLAAMAPEKMDVDETRGKAAKLRELAQALVAIAQDVLRYFREVAPLILPIITHPELTPEDIFAKSGENPVLVVRGAIRWYLHDQKKAGKISEIDEEAAASLLVFALFTVAVLEMMDPRSKALPNSGIEALIGTLCTGLRPKSETEARFSQSPPPKRRPAAAGRRRQREPKAVRDLL